MRRPLAVEILERRWDVTIIITYEDEIETYIVSADSGLTYGDGIWFGTAKEYNEAIMET